MTALSATLPGTWQLQSRIDLTASGDRRVEPSLGDDPLALLIYDRNGHFAAQFMRRGGYDAYFGTYTIDDEKGTVT
jgi:hypothetical protein